MVLYLNELEFPSLKDAFFCQVWLKLAQSFWRRRFFNFVNVFSLFLNYLLLEKGGTLHLNKPPPPKDALCQVRLKLTLWFRRRRFLNIFNIIFLFRHYLALEKGVALHLNKFESPSPKMFCAKFGWNYPSGLWEEDESLRQLRQQTTDKLWSEKLTSLRLRWAKKVPYTLSICLITALDPGTLDTLITGYNYHSARDFRHIYAAFHVLHCMC